MLSAKKLLYKLLDRQYIVKEYEISTTTNSGVSPFGAYASYEFPNKPSGYAVISMELVGLGSVNPATARPYNDFGAFVYSKSAGTFTLRVVFGKLGG